MRVDVSRDGEEIGSFRSEDLPELATTGFLRPDDYGWYEGLLNWEPLNQLFPNLVWDGKELMRPEEPLVLEPTVAPPDPPENPESLHPPIDRSSCWVRTKGESHRLEDPNQIQGMIVQGHLQPYDCLWIPDHQKWQTLQEWQPGLFRVVEFRRKGERLGEYYVVVAHHEVIEGRIEEDDLVREIGTEEWSKAGETFDVSFKERGRIYFTGGCFNPLLWAAAFGVAAWVLPDIFPGQLPAWSSDALLISGIVLALIALVWGWSAWSRTSKIIRCVACRSARTLVLSSDEVGQYVAEVPTFGFVWDERRRQETIGIKSVVTTMAVTDLKCYCINCGNRWVQRTKTDLGAEDRGPIAP